MRLRSTLAQCRLVANLIYDACINYLTLRELISDKHYQFWLVNVPTTGTHDCKMSKFKSVWCVVWPDIMRWMAWSLSGA